MRKVAFPWDQRYLFSSVSGVESIPHHHRCQRIFIYPFSRLLGSPVTFHLPNRYNRPKLPDWDARTSSRSRGRLTKTG